MSSARSRHELVLVAIASHLGCLDDDLLARIQSAEARELGAALRREDDRGDRAEAVAAQVRRVVDGLCAMEFRPKVLAPNT